MNNMYEYEEKLNKEGYNYIGGCDEYVRIGYIPEINLFLTFGMNENKFDAQAIHKKIAACSMPPPSMETIDMLKRF